MMNEQIVDDRRDLNLTTKELLVYQTIKSLGDGELMLDEICKAFYNKNKHIKIVMNQRLSMLLTIKSLSLKLELSGKGRMIRKSGIGRGNKYICQYQEFSNDVVAC